MRVIAIQREPHKIINTMKLGALTAFEIIDFPIQWLIQAKLLDLK